MIPGEGNGYSFRYSCMENPMDRGAWWATVHGVAELDMTEHSHNLLQGRDGGGEGGRCLSVYFPNSGKLFMLSPLVALDVIILLA